LVDLSIRAVVGDGEGIGNSVAILAILIYTFLALRRVYQQGRASTLFKLVMVSIGYALALVLTMLGTLIVTVAFI
jgi:hypothetical protein